MKFTKMQGLGNDYVYVDCTREELASPVDVARAVSDRHFGFRCVGKYVYDFGLTDKLDVSAD